MWGMQYLSGLVMALRRRKSPHGRQEPKIGLGTLEMPKGFWKGQQYLIEGDCRIQPDKKGPIHIAAFIGSYLKWHDELQHYDSYQVTSDEESDCVTTFMQRIEAIVLKNGITRQNNPYQNMHDSSR